MRTYVGILNQTHFYMNIYEVCWLQGSALSQMQVHDPVDNAATMAGDASVDDEYIPPPDYSVSDDVMAVPPGSFCEIDASKYSI